MIDLYVDEINRLRVERDRFFFESPLSPFPSELKKDLQELPYFSVNENYRVKVTLETRGKPKETEVVNFEGQTQTVNRVGKADFRTPGSEEAQSLEIYQDPTKDTFFTIFGDLTNTIGETYGAGRYVVLEKSSSGEWFMDFNKASSPYCSYSEKFPCPLVPKRNRLNVRIEAGEKYVGEH